MSSFLGTFPSYAALVASLPAAFVPPGTTAETIDFGMVESNGVYWWPQGISGGGISPVFSNSVSETLGSGPLNNLAVPGFVAGVTNRLILTPASGGTIINSLVAAGVPDGFTIKVSNPSSTDYLQFNHLGGGSASNEFRNPGNAAVYIPEGGAALLSYEVSVWTWV